MAQTIELQFTPTGEIIAEANGFEGNACDAIIEALSKGGEIVSSTKKPEFYKATKVASLRK